MAKRIIEAVVLLLGALVTVAIVIAIPLKSYNEYKDYLAQIEELNKPEIKPELESITAELKEGVKYFANDMAEAKAEDFIVTANYVKGEEKYSEPVEEGEVSVQTGSDFYMVGGEVKITYKKVSTTVTIQLEPVVLESIDVIVAPYTIKYQAGSTFDAAGMIVKAVYNDGSSKVLSADEYVVDNTKKLSTDDTAVTVSFTDGESTKTVDVAIGVSATLDNGNVESIVIVDNAIVNAGDYITNAVMEVNAVYESGNRKLLTKDQYTISGSADKVEFGKMYELTVSYNADTTKTAKTDIIVRQTVQGEDGIIVGGEKNAEPEYVINDGVITDLGNNVTFAGNFAKSVQNGQEGSLTLVINSVAETVGNITMRCSNSYACYANGVDKSGGYVMKPLQINTILDLTVNGREVKVPATVILKGCGPNDEFAPLYGIYYEFTFENVQLDAGVNNVKFNFKKSTAGAVTCWGESPSTMNIDYVNFDTLGSEIPDNYTITDIEILDEFAPQYAQKFDEIQIKSVIATLDNGTKIGISSDLYDSEILGGAEGDTSFGFGKYTLKVSLKSDPTVSATKEHTIEEYEIFTVRKVGVEVSDGKVYYVVSGDCVGYKADDIVFFDIDGENIIKYDIIVELTGTTFTFKVDVTDMDIGTQIYPHIEIDGKNYVNGNNNNGDIQISGLEYTEGQSVTLNNGKKYTMVTSYSMPTLVIEEHRIYDYTAAIDSSYTSDKTLLGEYVYGSTGVTTSGDNRNNEYPGGIGSMDKENAYITYTFTVSEDGKVDFVWNVAGSCWNETTKTNDGIVDASKHINVVIDGVEVDFAGIALPAGTGDDLWWNIRTIVIKDVALKAGEHTFTCTILGHGGLNIGEMEIYFAAND